MGKSRTNSGVLVVLDHGARIPLHRQIETSIRDSIRGGRLPRGSSLPPSRVLAADLGVSRGVVVEAYQRLAAEGYLASRAGGYTQVATGPSRATAGLRLARKTPPRIDLSYGRADVSSFPRAAWLRAIRGALASAPNDVFGYLAGSGVPQLRTAIADYLNRVRGTVAQPDQIVICTGYAQGAALLISVLVAAGAKRLALEDPSSGDDALPAARAAGLEVAGVPVDGDGIRMDVLRETGADAVVLTPPHQWPTGSVLSAKNRAGVLRWAAERGAVIIEDDYDAEYRYDRTPVGATGAGPRPRRLRRIGEQDPRARAAPGVVRDARTPGRANGRGQDSRRPRIARARAARPRRPHHPRRARSAPAADAPRSTGGAAGVGIEGVTPYRISHPSPGGLIFGYAIVNEHTIAEGVDILARVTAELQPAPSSAQHQ
jgi:GntR family transcriptional regulator/MocR family aminotransferase